MKFNRGVNKLGPQMRQYNRKNTEAKDIQLICLTFGVDEKRVKQYLSSNVASKTKIREYKNTQ